MVDRAILLKRAREMRNNPTEPEKRLWRHLSNSRLEGHKFRRQAIVDYYIADFICPQKRLIVEVDGDTHDIEADLKRDGRLKAQGYQTIRFSNVDVMNNMEGVLLMLVEALNQSSDRWRKTTPNPTFEKEGLK
jgi:very-short-patch-repair endonuclease